MNSVNKEELISTLDKQNIEIMVIDCPTIDAIDIYVFVKTKKDKIKLDKSLNNCYVTDGTDIKRPVVVSEIARLGVRRWFPVLQKRGKKLVGEVFVPSEADFEAIIMAYIFLVAKRKSYVTMKAVEYCFKKNLYHDFWGELADVFLCYLKQNELSVVTIEASEYAKIFIERKTNVFKRTLQWQFLWHKATGKLRIIRLQFRTIIHGMLLRHCHLNYMKKNLLNSQEWRLLNDAGGYSGALLIESHGSLGHLFIKGDKWSIYNSIINEIRAQRKLVDCVDKNWYMQMVQYDARNGWIAYPFVQYRSLGDGKKNLLDTSALNELGDFLIDILDKMYENNIVHCDLRPDNIIVQTLENGHVQFELTDFGCAYVEKVFPWKNSGGWGSYLSRTVCGDYRYNENIVDDAASAYLVYIELGGKTGDYAALEISKRIGRNYMFVRKGELYE